LDFPFDKLGEDVSPDSPSGPDLEMEGDADFMRFMAQIDGVLPQSFASFDRAGANLPEHVALVGGLLTKSKDLRLITAAAKLFILDRNLGAFASSIAAAADWLRSRWETLQPELLDGDPTMRSVALQSLDDMPHTVKPLEATPLFKSRRIGFVSLRSVLLSEGKIAARQGEEGGGEGEKAPNSADIAASIREADLDELVQLRGHADRLCAGLADIETIWAEKTGEQGVLTFAQLKPAARDVLRFLDGAVRSRDPSLALASVAGEESAPDDSPGAAGPTGDVGAIGGIDDARDALRAAAAYFRDREPSSPVRLLLAQAEALIGKSYFDALQQLAPELASQASVGLGPSLPFKLPLDRLAGLLVDDGGEQEPSSESSWQEPEAEPEAESESDESEAPEESGDRNDGAEDAGDLGDASAAAGPEGGTPSPRRAAAPAGNRAGAVALLDQAAAWFRANEPSSPIPVLIDAARATIGRDFAALLRDTLPRETFRVDEQ
jgi:type VI secretion system protein ImpA